MTRSSSARPQISVVIPTYQRASLLERSLVSLTAQTLPRSEFEVVVIDDGSSDGTADVCKRLSDDLDLHYFRIENSGPSAAKNLGLFASQAPLTLFFDDDDLADPSLLETHIEAHRAHPQENLAVLGYTTWGPELDVTPLMEYVTEIGQLLFSYRNIENGAMLDYTYFWAGRISCKRAFVAQHGVFDQGFHAPGIEDIELGFRLAKHGLKVLYVRAAQSFMVRAVTFDEFARRCVNRGRGLWVFNSRHLDPDVRRYCRVADALQRWPSLAPSLEAKMDRVRELERRHFEESGLEEGSLTELRELYGWTFEALQVAGIAEAAAEAAPAFPAHQAIPAGPSRPEICPNPVFIIGSPRSGTTVLAHSLAEHSDLWISGESDFLYFLFANGFVEEAFDRAMEVPGPRWLRLEGVTREEFLAYLGLGINALITSRSEGRRWIDHTPHYTLIVDALAQVFPGASFIHLIRDGRDVVQSMLNFADGVPDPAVGSFLKENVPWATDMRAACNAWQEHVEAAMHFCETHSDRTTIVRYEDLVAAPRPTFRRIYDFLGVVDEDGPARFLATRRINSSFNRRQRLSADELWERWDEEERRMFAEVAGPTMLRCGFSMPDQVIARSRANGVGG
jgi:glycosyltransferase involved in cell wall biosynthesis